MFHQKGYYCEGIPYEQGFPLSEAEWNSLDPLNHILKSGLDAFNSANWQGVDRNRIGVVLGNIALPTEKSAEIINEALIRARNEVPQNRNRNLDNFYNASQPARLLASSLNLGLGGYSLDAACASSLYALKYACDLLSKVRLMPCLQVGSVAPILFTLKWDSPSLRPCLRRGSCRPFDQSGDGLMVGEGGGIFVLKRLSDAKVQGDKILGVICGVGLSNDMGGKLMAPSSEGQLRAMQAAYEEAQWDPTDVDYIECHATGTPLGDQVECESLHKLWENSAGKSCVASSVKGNIGHLLTAAGASGLVRLLLAMNKKTLPPNANLENPLPMLGEGSPISLLSEAMSWQEPLGRGRRAALSGFGFGGINGHVLVEEYHEKLADENRQADPQEIAVVAVHSRRASQDPQGRKISTAELPETNQWFGLEKSDWFLDQVGEPNSYQLEALDPPLGRYKIPPRELQDMLPQQILALESCWQAWQQSKVSSHKEKLGVYFGLELDGRVSAYRQRWEIESDFAKLAKNQNPLSEDDYEAWVEKRKDAAYQFLTADRVMGALASIIPSRMAREFKVGGPAITVSALEDSGLQALELACQAIARGDLKTAIVGAVDMAGSPFTALARSGQELKAACWKMVWPLSFFKRSRWLWLKDKQSLQPSKQIVAVLAR